MIIYFTGTGNSRYVAEKLAERLGHELVDASEYMRKHVTGEFHDQTVIFVAPVYAAAPPMVFMDLIRRSTFAEGTRAYFVMTCAVNMGGSSWYCQQLARDKGLDYMGTYRLSMPQNYILLFDSWNDEKVRSCLESAAGEIEQIAERVERGREFPDPGTKKWEIISTRMVLKAYYRWFVKADKFRATEVCIGCGKCAQLCPLGNIRMENGHPVWGKECTHCMGCLNLCPADAVEYGRKTHEKKRYKGVPR